jgi:hypothetical protein
MYKIKLLNEIIYATERPCYKDCRVAIRGYRYTETLKNNYPKVDDAAIKMYWIKLNARIIEAYNVPILVETTLSKKEYKNVKIIQMMLKKQIFNGMLIQHTKDDNTYVLVVEKAEKANEEVKKLQQGEEISDQFEKI